MSKAEQKYNKIKNSFPYKYSEGLTLYLNGEIVVEHDDRNGSNEYYLDLIDQDGYRYFIESSSVFHNQAKSLNRFFKRNKYTYDNINLYCKLNNIDLHIDGTNLPFVGMAREKLNFVDSNGTIHKISWNQVQHYTFQYQDGYEEVKAKRKVKKILYQYYRQLWI